MALNDDLLDRSVQHAHYLEKYKTGRANALIDLLVKFDREQKKELILYGEQESYSVKKQEQIIQQFLEAEKDFASNYTSDIIETSTEFGAYEADFQATMLKDEVPLPVQAIIPIKTASQAQVWSFAINRPMTMAGAQTAFIKPFIKSISENRLNIIENTIRAGFVLGKSTPQIARELYGTQAQYFQDGNMKKGYSWAESVVRTSINHMAASAREMSNQANRDIIKGYRWLSILDGRTTYICATLSGKEWYYDNPDKSTLPSALQPPQHPRCRSCTVPITPSWRELGIDIDEIDGQTQASMNGQVPKEWNYSDWMARQPESFQRAWMGASRYEAYKKGELKITQFTDIKTGDIKTLKDLGVEDVRYKAE